MSAGRDHRAQVSQRAQRRALGQHAILGRRHAQHVDALALHQLQALGRVKALVVQQRRRAAQPWRDEHVARGLRPAAGRRAPDQLAGARAEPVLGLQALTGQVALRVNDRLRLPARAAGEREQARIRGPQRGGRGRLAVVQALVGNEHDAAFGPRSLELCAVALVGEDQRRAHSVQAQAQVFGA
jgi:hypothetical protein